MSSLLWGLLIGLAVLWLFRMISRGGGCCGGEDAEDSKNEVAGRPTNTREIEAVVDPVCGMTLEKEGAAHRLKHGGAVYYFCSSKCHEAFEAEPAKYLSVHPAAH